jgi:hypothetical protein
MNDPEIARRCVSCGASIRDRALFCPQCGNPVGDETKNLNESADNFTEALLNTPQNQTVELNRTLAEPTGELERPVEPTVELDRTVAESFAATKPLVTRPVSERPAAQPSRRLQRAAAAKEAFEGDVIQRVDQIRKISSVVIDQASYDPSLRFILVAAGLFLLFLTILIISKLIG